MKVLVTGATGFIGSRLCRKLSEKDCAVTALVLPGEGVDHIAGDVTEFRYGDLTGPESLRGIGRGVDIVFHLAARVTDWGRRHLFYDSILGGTRSLLEECTGDVSRFVYVSSMAACGLGRHLKGLDEDDEPRKSGVPYNDAKLDTERLVGSYRETRGLSCTIVRPANVIGPGSVWVRDIIERYRTGIVPLIDGGRYSASLLYVDNLVDGLYRSGTMDAADGRTYFFRDDWDVTWKRYVEDLGAMIGKKPLGSVPFPLAWFLGYLLEMLLSPLNIRPPVTRLAAGVMGRDNDVRTARAADELGWRTMVSYDEAMTTIGRWVREKM